MNDYDRDEVVRTFRGFGVAVLLAAPFWGLLAWVVLR